MMGWSRRRLLILAALLYLASLLATLPASLFVARINAISPQLQLRDVEGSIWHGRIGQLSINGRQLRDVDWSFEPLALFAGRLQLGLAYATANNDLSMSVALGLGNTLHIRHLQGQLNPAFVQAFTAYSYPVVHGTLLFRDAGLVIHNRRPQQLYGEVEWRDAAVELGQSFALGSLLLAMETTEEGMKGVLSEQSGLLDGEARVLLTELGRYSVEVRVTPAAKGRYLEPQLGLVLRKNPDGSYGRSYSGQLP